jgi:hypothetical protein
MKIIILILLVFTSNMYSQVVIVDYNDVLEQYNEYVKLNDSTIKNIFKWELLKMQFINNIQSKVLTKENDVNMDQYTFKYIPYGSISLNEKKGDTLYCSFKIDKLQLPSATLVFKDGNLLMRMEGVRLNFIIFEKELLLEKNYECIDFTNRHILLLLCNMLSGVNVIIDTENRTISSQFCNYDLPKESIGINDNHLSIYFFNLINQLNQNEGCIPVTNSIWQEINFENKYNWQNIYRIK